MCDSNNPTHDGVHRVLAFYINCKNHKIPVWIYGKYDIKSNPYNFDFNKPDGIEMYEKNEYVYFKIPTGM